MNNNQTTNITITRAAYHGKDYRPLVVKVNEKAKTGLKAAALTGILTTGVMTTVDTPSVSAESGVTTHVVQKGDTLSALAKTYSVTVQQIKNHNDLHSDTIYIKQNLLVPDKKTSAVVSKAVVSAPQANTAKPSLASASHIVVAGDTLSSIARTYKTTVKEIKAWNNLKGDLIYPGQRLALHSEKAAVAVKEQTDKKITEGMYTVQSGDTLWRISRTFNVSVEYLLKANNLSSASLLPGQQLVVSADTKATAKQSANTQAPAPTVSTAKNVHVVQAGDNLTKIAIKAGTSLHALTKINGLSLDSTIKVGQRITLPTSIVEIGHGTITGIVDNNSIEVHLNHFGDYVLGVQNGNAMDYASKEGEFHQFTFSLGNESERPMLIAID